MHADFQRLMQDATRLTRQGELHAATAAIQAALAGPQAQEAGETGRDMVIDVEARFLPEPGDEMAQAPQREREQQEAFITGHFGTGAAGRDYKLYIPPGASSRPMPLVVMLHGCTQNPDDFAAGTAMNEAARAQGFFVLYPAQSQKANPQRCWNWFKHSHQARGRGEPAILAGMTREVMARHAIDAGRVYVAGLSAGGAMAAILGQAYPDLFAAVGVHSGLAAGAASDLPSALQAMKGAPPADKAVGAAAPVPTIVIHGDKDATVHASNGERVYAESAGAGSSAQTETGRTPGGRSWTRRIHRDAGGKAIAEHWLVHGAAHAWSGGSSKGSYTDPQGPDATRAMLDFFWQHARAA